MVSYPPDSEGKSDGEADLTEDETSASHAASVFSRSVDLRETNVAGDDGDQGAANDAEDQGHNCKPISVKITSRPLLQPVTRHCSTT